MKNKILLVITCCFILTNCSLEDNSSTYQEISYLRQWHLVKVNGGIAGLQDEFSLGTIILDFNGTNNILTVENNNTDDSKEDFLDSGTYPYSELDQNGLIYLIIDGIEYGERTFSSNNTIITIDANSLSNGTGTDGFVYTLQRVLVEDI